MGIQRPRPDLPDVFVGLGGAGKNVLRSFLNQEWIMESVAAAAVDGEQPKCYFVDACTADLQEDNRIAAELNDRIQEAIHLENDVIPGGVGDVVSVLNLAEYIESETPGPQALVMEQMVERIVQETDVETWWPTGEDPAAYRPAYERFCMGTARR
jgi:hypothetical protein